jgi:hypothetical protein
MVFLRRRRLTCGRLTFSTPCDDRSTATSASREFPGHDCCKPNKSCSLILFFSKSLLRHPLARSNIEELAEGTKFIPYIPEPQPESLCAPEDVKRHIICSGQVYYQLLQERENRKLNNVAISRMEQISPVPYALVTPHLDTYPNADLMWAQEEPVRALSPPDLRRIVADYFCACIGKQRRVELHAAALGARVQPDAAPQGQAGHLRRPR